MNAAYSDNDEALKEQMDIMLAKMEQLKSVMGSEIGPIVQSESSGIRPSTVLQEHAIGASGEGPKVNAPVPHPSRAKIYGKRAMTFLWALIKLICWTSKLAVALYVLLTVASISTSVILDYRIIEPQFLNITQGVLAPKYTKAIGQWQLAINQLVFNLDPKYPLYKMEQKTIWTNMNRAWESYFA